jgi:hypothetical protein
MLGAGSARRPTGSDPGASDATMTRKPSIDGLWESVRSGQHAFQSSQLSGLTEAARRYLEHAIAPAVLLASAVRLRMHGEIKLGRWLPFTAEQVIYWGHGMIWSATVRMNGMPVRGFDRLVDGVGAMRWKLFGVVPIMTASGPDISRSAAGRVMAESVWLPSVLCGDDVSWTAQDSFRPHACLTVQGEPGELTLAIDDQGRLQSLTLRRWGNPGGAAFHYVDFGGVAEEERRFGGYTIPTRLRVGWYVGTDRFEPDGEFFRVTIDDAAYR